MEEAFSEAEDLLMAESQRDVDEVGESFCFKGLSQLRCQLCNSALVSFSGGYCGEIDDW